jgi:hypothetical protein
MIAILNFPLENTQQTSASILSGAAARTASSLAASDRARAYVDALTASLKSFAVEDSEIDQRWFWRVFGEFQREVIDFSNLAKALTPDFDLKFALPSTTDELAIWPTANFDAWIQSSRASTTDRQAHDIDIFVECKRPLSSRSYVGDRSVPDRYFQQYFDVLHETYHEISHKAAKRAIRASIAELDLDTLKSIDEFVRLISSTLAEKVTLVVRLVVRARTPQCRRPHDDETRHRILSFFIHTGNSPPVALSESRLVHSRALVNLNTNARSEFNETLQPRHRSRDLRNSLYSRHSRLRDNRRARKHACIDGCTQPSRCCGSWINRSLAQAA